MSNRAQQSRIAQALNNALGSDYKVAYDECDSGLTRCYYKGLLYKQVENDCMRSDINVCEYVAPTALKLEMPYR